MIYLIFSCAPSGARSRNARVGKRYREFFERTKITFDWCRDIKGKASGIYTKRVPFIEMNMKGA